MPRIGPWGGWASWAWWRGVLRRVSFLLFGFDAVWFPTGRKVGSCSDGKQSRDFPPPPSVNKNKPHADIETTTDVDSFHPTAHPHLPTTELHGYLRALVCLTCHNEYPRSAFQTQLSNLNQSSLKEFKLKYPNQLLHLNQDKLTKPQLLSLNQNNLNKPQLKHPE